MVRSVGISHMFTKLRTVLSTFVISMVNTTIFLTKATPTSVSTIPKVLFSFNRPQVLLKVPGVFLSFLQSLRGRLKRMIPVPFEWAF